MAEQPKSAAAALYPHLRQASSAPVQREHGDLASVMYPRPQPKPQNPYLEPMTETEWRDQLWALAGLRRKR
jgi:hypothetical protein